MLEEPEVEAWRLVVLVTRKMTPEVKNLM